MEDGPERPWSRHSWRPTEAPPEGQREAYVRLANAIRETVALLMESDAPADELLAAAERAEHFNERLSRGPKGRPLWGYAEASTSGNPRAFYDSSPLSGPANPLAPPLEMEVNGAEIVGRVTFGVAYEGPPGHVHGGVVAAAFDELLGYVQSTTGHPGMTGTLMVRYRRPTPLNVELRLRGSVERVEGRKIITRGTLHHGEALCAEAEAVFVSVERERFERLAEQYAPPV
jgi:acyl-coenzyme A thioesterase PaaI-like protein